MPLHPQVERFLADTAGNNAPGWSAFTPEDARVEFSGRTHMFGEGPELHRVEDAIVADEIPVRIYQSCQQPTGPAVMFFHGGGWVLGDLDSHDALCRRIAAEADCTVVAVHYRRAPEAPYPAAVEDCYNATSYIHTHAAKMNINASQLIVAGDSAGGNLAAAVCLKARDENGPEIGGQILIYPITTHDFETPSYCEYATGFGLTRESMIWFWEQYLDGQPAGPLSVPLLAESLQGLPATHIVLAEFDVLRSEGEQYAERLLQAGVNTTVCRYDGMLHGFVHFCGTFDVGLQAVTDIGAAIRSMV